MAAPTDLRAALVDELTTTLAAWLSERGVQDRPQLAPPTRADAGDLALPCHPYARHLRRNPKLIAEDLASVARGHPLVDRADAVNGFLNLHLDWTSLAPRVLAWAQSSDGALGRSQVLGGDKLLIEYSSPNTNKPQHLGHCRNNLLGHAVASLAEAAGARVTRINLVNDRGIHICKSMVAYERFADGATPASLGVKGDHFIGDLYVRFNDALKAELDAAFPQGDGPDPDTWFNTDSELGQRAREMLQLWEEGDLEIVALWRTMNSWCEAGFAETYARMGVRFDRIQKESETWMLGKAIVQQGLADGVFHHADNGAVVFDQERIGLEGDKAVLRADGTSLYITQDLGTAASRFQEYAPDRMIYVVGNEQDHYFRVLFGILGQLLPELQGKLVHRSYGMVELTTGKMKSREGTVVDADDLMDDLQREALAQNQERWAELPEDERVQRAEAVAMAGLKYYLLRFNPDRSFVFDPASSIAFEGDTGPYCVYAHARAATLLDKLGDAVEGVQPDWSALAEPNAVKVMAALLAVPDLVTKGARDLDPSYLTTALYDLAKAFASFYAAPEGRVIGAPPGPAAAKAALVRATRRVLAGLVELLGIEALEEM